MGRKRRRDDGRGSGRYYILIDDALRVERRQKMDVPALGSGLGMWWIAVSKSVWGKYRAGDVMKAEDVPSVNLDRIREARRVRAQREMEMRVLA